ncbi:hypothetical protein QTH97_23385 [Variovorax sp. J22R24]|uniref:hypothetical protein n=1 Tax=Variovorax gracilis TaxID=3053502 RepID=UPI0025790B37|nr:hypothetical protein [Variovorax sp. J22R24]MDM0107910.1 hypothetical protein [Variovorax sp. J22R24]
MRSTALRSAAWIVAAASGLAAAQGNGGSQTPCELRFSTCKQTARADYQFCKNAKEKNCRPRLDDALKGCTTARNSCQLAAGAQG